MSKVRACPQNAGRRPDEIQQGGMDQQRPKSAKVSLASKAREMPQRTRQSPDVHDLDAKAAAALEEARDMPPGAERTEAMKKAGILRNAADIQGLFFAKRGRPAK
jgi:hypothetical protein